MFLFKEFFAVNHFFRNEKNMIYIYGIMIRRGIYKCIFRFYNSMELLSAIFFNKQARKKKSIPSKKLYSTL